MVAGLSWAERSRHFEAPRESKWGWCAGEEVVMMVGEGPRARRRSWTAMAPTTELAPRTSIEDGRGLVGSGLPMEGRGILRPRTIEAAAVR